MDIKSIIANIVEKKLKKDSDDPCWDEYVQLGMKKKDGKEVPNCVPKESVELDEVLAKDYSGMLGSFKKAVERAEQAKKKGSTEKMEMQLDNARRYLFGMKSTDTAKLKNTDHYDRYKKMKSLKETVELDEAKNTLVARYMNKDGNNVLYFEIWEKPNGNLYSKISNQRGLNIAASAIDLRSSHADAKRNVERAVMFYDQDGDSGALRHLNHLLPGWKKVPIQESADLSERVEVDHSRYMRSHSKKARGRGMWMFTTKDMGEPSEDEMVTVSGDLSTAAKEAAKKLGTKRVYVMEMVDLDEVSMDKIRKVRDRAADRIAGAVGKTDKDPKTGLSRYVPPTDKEKELGQKGVKSFRAASRAITRKSKNEEVELDESFNLELGTKVAMKDKGKTIYGKIIGKEKVMGEPGVEVKWDSGVKGRFKMSAFAGLSMDRKADYIISESVELEEDYITENATDYDTYNDYVKANKKKGVQVIPKKLWDNMKADSMKESTDLAEDVHNDLNDAIIEFQKKLMRMTRQLDPAIAKEVKKIDKDLDDLRSGPLFKIRPGR